MKVLFTFGQNTLVFEDAAKNLPYPYWKAGCSIHEAMGVLFSSMQFQGGKLIVNGLEITPTDRIQTCGFALCPKDVVLAKPADGEAFKLTVEDLLNHAPDCV